MGVLTKYSKKMARKTSKRKPMMKFTKGGKYKKTDYSSLLVRPDTEDETDGISLGDSDSFNEDSMEEFIVDDDNTESDSWTSSSSDPSTDSESTDDDFLVEDAKAKVPTKSFKNPYLNRREINLDEYVHMVENLFRQKLGYPFRKSTCQSKLESSIDYACSKLMTGAWNARALKIIKESKRWKVVQLEDSQRRNAKCSITNRKRLIQFRIKTDTEVLQTGPDTMERVYYYRFLVSYFECLSEDIDAMVEYEKPVKGKKNQDSQIMRLMDYWDAECVQAYRKVKHMLEVAKHLDMKLQRVSAFIYDEKKRDTFFKYFG